MYVSWNNHTINLTVSVVKEVTCEKCKTQYCYALKRTEFGTGTSVYGLDEQGAQNRAADRAAQKLNDTLRDAFEVVPCPTCGNYQAQMVQFLKNAHLKWLIIPAAILVLGSIIALVVSFRQGNASLAAGAVGALVAGIGLFAFRGWSVGNFDPNAGDPEPRKQIGRELALLKQAEPETTGEPKKSAPPTNWRRRRTQQ